MKVLPSGFPSSTSKEHNQNQSWQLQSSLYLNSQRYNKMFHSSTSFSALFLLDDESSKCLPAFEIKHILTYPKFGYREIVLPCLLQLSNNHQVKLQLFSIAKTHELMVLFCLISLVEYGSQQGWLKIVFITKGNRELKVFIARSDKDLFLHSLAKSSIKFYCNCWSKAYESKCLHEITKQFRSCRSTFTQQVYKGYSSVCNYNGDEGYVIVGSCENMILIKDGFEIKKFSRNTPFLDHQYWVQILDDWLSFDSRGSKLAFLFQMRAYSVQIQESALMKNAMHTSERKDMQRAAVSSNQSTLLRTEIKNESRQTKQTCEVLKMDVEESHDEKVQKRLIFDSYQNGKNQKSLPLRIEQMELDSLSIAFSQSKLMLQESAFGSKIIEANSQKHNGCISESGIYQQVQVEVIKSELIQELIAIEQQMIEENKQSQIQQWECKKKFEENKISCFEKIEEKGQQYDYNQLNEGSNSNSFVSKDNQTVRSAFTIVKCRDLSEYPSARNQGNELFSSYTLSSVKSFNQLPLMFKNTRVKMTEQDAGRNQLAHSQSMQQMSFPKKNLQIKIRLKQEEYKQIESFVDILQISYNKIVTLTESKQIKVGQISTKNGQFNESILSLKAQNGKFRPTKLFASPIQHSLLFLEQTSKKIIFYDFNKQKSTSLLTNSDYFHEIKQIKGVDVHTYWMLNDYELRLIDGRTGKIEKQKVFKNHRFSLQKMDFLDDWAAVGQEDGVVKIYDLRNMEKRSVNKFDLRLDTFKKGLYYKRGQKTDLFKSLQIVKSSKDIFCCYDSSAFVINSRSKKDNSSIFEKTIRCKDREFVRKYPEDLQEGREAKIRENLLFSQYSINKEGNKIAALVQGQCYQMDLDQKTMRKKIISKPKEKSIYYAFDKFTQGDRLLCLIKSSSGLCFKSIL